MIAFVGILLLCGFVLFLTDFISGFTVRHETVISIAGWGICAALMIGFFVVYL